eukprot:539888-Rhodomonas_salina.1
MLILPPVYAVVRSREGGSHISYLITDGGVRRHVTTLFIETTPHVTSKPTLTLYIGFRRLDAGTKPGVPRCSSGRGSAR